MSTRTRKAKRSDGKPVALVAGGAGFLGSHLCERLLASGSKVVCIDNLQTGSRDNLRSFASHDDFSLIVADICDPLPALARVDAIYNLACPASPPHYQADPIHTMMTSVVGTRNLLELARTCRARFLQSSTSEVYGDPELHPQQETYRGNVNPIGPRACYDEGKRAAEALCFDYRRKHQLDVRVARIFNTYGPRMRADDGRIVSNFVVQALSGEPMTIYGTGEQTRSFCFVSDLIEGLIRLMTIEDNPDVPINIGNPEEYSIKQFATLIGALTGSFTRLVYQPLPCDDPRCRRPDIRRAQKILDWKPRVSVRHGLALTIEWFAAELGRGRPGTPIGTPRPVVDFDLQAITRVDALDTRS